MTESDGVGGMFWHFLLVSFLAVGGLNTVIPDIQRYVDALNEFVIAAKGRIYLSKDRFTRPEHFRAMEPRLPTFFAARDKWDPERRLRSAQSRRLFGDPAAERA